MSEIKYISYDELERKKYLSEICRFTKITQETVNEIKNYKPNHKEHDTDKRLWAIFGKKNDNWVCLEVGSSKDIKNELKDNLNAMISVPFCLKKSTTFHDDVYEFYTYMDRHSVKYRAMYKMCKDFVFYEIDVSEYLKGVNYGGYNQVNYAEVMFAYETKAMFWNPAPATYGNQEREIYDNVFKNKKC